MISKIFLILIFVFLLVAGFLFGKSLWEPVIQKIKGRRTVNDVIEIYGTQVRNKISPVFEKAGISYPPQKLIFLAMKEEHLLEVWASNNNEDFSFIQSYGIEKLSGNDGPKLREGDGQVPEGIYKIIGLNPNSSYHLSMKLNYPNEFDLLHAKNEGRNRPGGDIFIHGKSVSIGCLAMGDKTIEELFVLSSDVGIENIMVVISPYDPRSKKLKYNENTQPEWVKELYDNIEKKFDKYQKSLGINSKAQS